MQRFDVSCLGFIIYAFFAPTDTMITAIQNFISKRGKFVFILLAPAGYFFIRFVSSRILHFDLLPDPNREKQEFYGYDWNDPDERRFLSITNRVAADFGGCSTDCRCV